MGWIKTDRSIQDHWLWDDKPYAYGQAWIDLLMLAAYEDKKVLWKNKLIDVKRGQYLTSIRYLAERWGWSKDRVMRYIALLKSDGMIDTDKDSGRTLITIENYRFFQDVPDADKDSYKYTDKDTDKDASRTLTRTQTRTKTKNKRIKEEKNNNIYGDFFAICWQAYPKKKGKGSISESKIKFLYDHVGQEQMLRCIERYKSELSGKDNQFVMYGSTFFNSGYVDYLDENYEKSATNPSYADDNAVMKQNITDEYIHLCNAIPGCRDDNNQQLRTKYWSIIQSDNLEIAWHNAMQISEIASKEVRRVEKQERELFTLGEFLNELSSRNSSNRKSAG